MKTLNKSVRDIVALRVLEHAFAARFLALVAERQRLAFEVYGQIVDEADVIHLGEPWVTRERRQFQVRIEDSPRSHDFDITGRMKSYSAIREVFGPGRVAFWTDTIEPDRSITLPVHGGSLSTPRFRSATGGLWLSKVRDLEERTDKLVDEMMARYAEIMGTLNAHRTVAKLLEAWPEIEPFLPDVARAEQKAKTKPDTKSLSRSLNLS